ncbi:hypothetical protein [Methylomicrobium lacus]|uniref:hypothetical protein n=1 Tax=Methylomicrobium lacus TaxID=136992 RepID=UPI0035A99675
MNQANTNIKRMPWCLIIMMLSGCAQQSLPRPVTDATERYFGTGYSLLPPQGNDWHFLEQSPNLTVFGKALSAQRKKLMHTFVATVMVMQPEIKKVNFAAEFPKAQEELFRAQLNREGFRLLSLQSAPYGLPGSYCSRYDLEQEERNNPYTPGIVFNITVHGFVCLDASSEFMIDASYSERRPQGSAAALDDKLKGEAEGFLRNIAVSPLRQSKD